MSPTMHLPACPGYGSSHDPVCGGVGKLSGIASEKISDHPTCRRWVLDERRLTSAIGDLVHPAMIKSSLDHVVKRTA